MGAIENSLKKLLDKEDLSFKEAEDSMKEIMTGKVSDIKFSAWLTALRMKGENANEIAGCAKIMRECASTISCNDKNAIDIVGTGGDGANTINISTASAIVTAGAGVTVAKHGNRAISSKSGAADVLSSLGIKIDNTPEKMEECLNSIGLSFLFAPLLHPAMKYAMPVRKELGMRSIFNILGPICNPANVKRAVIGVYDKRLCPIIAQAVTELGAEHFLVIHGADKLDEISTTGKAFVCESKNGKITEYELNPEDLGIKKANLSDIRGGTPEENAEILKGVFKGEITNPYLDIILINSASAIYISGKVDTWKEALDLAKDSITSGKAYKKLEELVNFTNNK